MRYWAALVVPCAVLLSGCQKGATVEGDLSLGTTKGQYRTVALVRNNADSLLAAIDAACVAERADVAHQTENIRTLNATADTYRHTRGKTPMAEVALGDSADKYRQAASEAQRSLSERPDTTYQKNMALIQAATDTQVEADANGHFRFAKRQKGSYVLYVQWNSPKADNEFLAPVDARADGKKTQNLDQSAVSTRLHCR